ncbi:MAG: serine/threonine protein kinase [Sandaracinaceae bacterium]|nr:serine/threonine protein kinase [Sandaracinaceae bacterium]
MTPPLIDPALRSCADTLDAIAHPPTATITPREPAESVAQRLHTLRSLCQGPAGGGVRLRGRLGEGGMGEVLLAEQVSMERDVAVKRLKPEARNDYSTLKLLQEAWVTGYLEHPNVIPVYDITVDAQGSPLILLKRIHGVAWGELMDDPETVRRRWGAADLLEWNLRVLMQVCDAVQFAHARGIVHRDLKPENVMVGEHGQVYVVDWGIAVTLREELASRLPLANKASELAGTPCYMAPEMLGRPGDQLSPRTDVYLLGAMLYEIMLSARPHPGNSFAEILASVLASPPPIPDDAPQELTRICTQAMALHPHDRHASALDFKLALEGFVRHRGSRRLARRASRRLEQLYGELAQAEPGQRDPERHLRLHRLHAECRFAFREALKEWPENGAAQRGLRAATLSMVEYELDNHDARGAATMLGRISEPPPPLAKRVAEAERRDEHERARMAMFRGGGLRPALRYPARLALSVGLGAGVPLLLAELASPAGSVGREPGLLPLLACAALLALMVERFVLRAPPSRSARAAATPDPGEALRLPAAARSPLAVFRDLGVDAVDRTYVELRDLRSRTRGAATTSLQPPR